MIDAVARRWPLWVAGGALLVIFYPLLRGEVLFWGLPSLQFHPWRDLAVEMLRGGQLPLWNPYNGAGAPLLANYQSQIFYPLSWPGFILPAGFALSVTAVIHLWIAAAGMWAFTRRLGVPVLGAGVSALAFGLTSYLVARLGTYPVISAAAWMPWLLWAVLGVMQRGRLRDMGWLALITALQLLTGHAQTTWYSLLLTGLFLLYTLLRQRPPGWRKSVALAAGGVLLGAMIAAVQLLPTAELLRTSQRSGGVDFDFAMNFSYGPVRALNFLSPNVFGNPGDGSYVTEGAFFEDAVYIGLVPLVGALAAMLGWMLRRFRKNLDTPDHFVTVPFWMAIALVAFIFALGSNTGIYPFLFRNVPTFSLFQAPVRWHIWTVFALSVLAGIGVTAAWGRGYWLFFGTRLATAGCVGAVVLALVVMPLVIPADTLDNEGVQVLINAVVYTAILGAVAGGLTLLQPDRDTARHGWWSLGVVMVVAVDLVFAAQGLNPTVDRGFYDRLPVVQADNGRGYWPEGEEEVLATIQFKGFLPFDDYRVAVENRTDYRETNLPNMNIFERRYLLNNFDPLRVGHFSQYIDYVEMDAGWQETWLRAAGVGRVYQDGGAKKPLTGDSARAWFAETACFHADEAAVIGAMQAADWEPLTTVHVVGTGACVSGATGTVAEIEDRGNSLTLAVEAGDGGWLVLADTDYPGWVAAVDGVEVPIQRANLAFRAVEVPAGAREVRFEYRPAWLLPGALVSVVGFIVLLLVFRLGNPNAE